MNVNHDKLVWNAVPIHKPKKEERKPPKPRQPIPGTSKANNDEKKVIIFKKSICLIKINLKSYSSLITAPK